MSLKLGEKWVDIRVSTLPSSFGERLVLRLLDKADASLDLEELGMTSEMTKDYLQQLKSTSGIILVTGPTGSGKTTTLYSGLNFLNDQTRNILTVEDPIEYALEGVGQTQVNNKVGLSFSKGLRAILRQDPDVVMVGEIRDKETAETAIQASLTGHLVLSTIHTNDSVGAITRLIDMGVEPYLLASTLKMVIAQRLVRKLTNKNEFSGRVGIFEMIKIDSEIKNYIYLSDIYIGNDSFGHHISSQMGKPSFVILLDTPRAYTDYSVNQKKIIPHVSEVFLGHVRYGTFGKNSKDSVHPFLRQNNWMHRNLIVAGNFNMTNNKELFDNLVMLGQHPKEISDTVTVIEKIGHFLDNEVAKIYKNLKKQNVSKIEASPIIEESLDIPRILKKASEDWDGGLSLIHISEPTRPY